MANQLEILLSTFNGELHLSEQLESLLNQSFTDWRLLIRDDGSSDATCEVIEKFVSDYPEKALWLKDGLGNIGVVRSYAELMAQGTAQYIAFCDQDDVWLPEKLSLQMNKMYQVEAEFGANTPVLISSDLTVVDELLNELSPSLWKYQNVNPLKNSHFKSLLVQNHMTGCTFLMNRQLAASVLPIAGAAIMHDWWVALIAAAKGKIVNIKTPTILYRQHAENEVGTIKYNFTYVLKEFLKGSMRNRNRLVATKEQAEALLESGLIDGSCNQEIQSYVEMFKRNWFERRRLMLQRKYFKYGFWRNVAMFIYL